MPDTDGRSPYVGLAPYDAAEREFFFGREEETSIVISNLYAAPLTVLYGASGVGKSSVLRAGVIPELRLKRGAAVVLFRGWHQPDFLQKLRSGCVDAVREASGKAFDAPPSEPLDELLARAGSHLGGPVLLVFDQFEEYLIHHLQVPLDDPFETEFARSINRQDVDAGFLVALREDWLSRLDRFRIRIPYLLDNILQLMHLKYDPAAPPDNRSAAERAVREPLRVYNERYAAPGKAVSIEDGLVREVLEQVGTRTALGSSVAVAGTVAGVVTPFLQLVMTRLWTEEARSEPHALRLETFLRLGGAPAIVRSYLNDVMQSLPRSDQEICARMFVFLVTPSGTKIPQKPEDLAIQARADEGLVRRILERLSENRILCPIDRPERYEVFHDALAPAVVEWRINFEKMLERADADRRAEEQRLRAEMEAAEARRLWAVLRRLRFRILVVALTLCLLAMITAVVLFVRQTRISRSQELAASSVQQSETGDPELGILLALKSAEASTPITAEAEGALHRAVQRSRVRATLRGHQGGVNGIAAADAADLVITAGADGTARLWERSTGKLQRSIAAGTGPLTGVAVNADGSRIVTAGESGAAVWDAASGTRLATLTHRGELITAVAASRDGTKFATAAGNLARLWTASGQELRSFEGHYKPILSLAFSADGTRLATGSEDGAAMVWETGSARRICRLLPQDASGAFTSAEPVQSVAFDPVDATHVATAGQDGAGRIWNTATARMVAMLTQKDAITPLPGHSNIVAAVAFSADGRLVATASWDRTARVWDAATGQEMLVLRGHLDAVTGVVFTQDGSHLATSSRDDTAKIWNIGPLPESLAIAASRERLLRVVYSPDGQWLASAAADRTARIWDLSGKLLRTLPHESEVTSAAFSPDGAAIATGGTDGSVNVWNAKSGEKLFALAHPGVILDVAYGADGRSLVTACWDDQVRIWNLQSRSVQWTAHSDERLTAMAYDGANRLATADVHGRATLWDVAARRQLRTMDAPGFTILTMAFSPDGQTLATGSDNGTLRLWQVATGEEQPAIPAHSGWLRDAAYSPDRTRLATVGRDGTLILWSAATGTRLLTLNPLSGPLNSVAFAPGGRYIATAGEDGTLRVFTLDVKELEALARSRATRGLEDQECKTYLHLSRCPAGT